MRFLTDYLQGDVYFHTSRKGHNLDRCRTQFALVADMESKWEKMEEIVKKLRDMSPFYDEINAKTAKSREGVLQQGG